MHRLSIVFAAMAGCAAAVRPVIAQDALGDGRALDNNLQVGSGGRNAPVRSLDAQLRFQNAIVTGNAPGGLRFRGDVGYRAPGEFTGDLAGNLTFQFRRDTLFSGIAGSGIRGTEALQFQFDLLTGTNNTTNLAGNLVVARPHTGAYVGETAHGRGMAYVPPPGGAPGIGEDAIHTLDMSDVAYDTRGGMLWNVRAPSTVIADDPLRPAFMDWRTDDEGNVYRLTASTLGGITLVKTEPDDSAKEATPDVTPLDMRSPLTTPGMEPVAPGVQQPDEPQQDASARTYEDIIRQYETAFAPVADEAPPGANDDSPSWRERILALRASLLPSPTGDAPAQTDADTADTGAIDIPGLDAADLIKEGIGRIDDLAPAGIGGIDGYMVNMQLGEKWLASGRYFSAEERFARALSARPGDAMAAVGRLHAQIGAGMYLSATLNLRDLFALHPEIIGVTYDADALPDAERLAAVKSDLRTQLAKDAGLPAESGLVLAYIGYQTKDPLTIKEGLQAASDHAHATGDQPLTRLVELLRAVWLGHGDTTPEVP